MESLSASLREKEREEETLTISTHNEFLSRWVEALLAQAGDGDPC